MTPGLLFLPNSEAPPVVLAGRAHLIGKAEVVRPAFLLGAPPAAPNKREDAGLARGRYPHGADEIGAAGLSLDREMVDIELGVAGEHVLEHPRDLHPGRVAKNLEAVGSSRLEKPNDIGFERLRSTRFGQELSELRMDVGQH